VKEERRGLRGGDSSKVNRKRRYTLIQKDGQAVEAGEETMRRKLRNEAGGLQWVLRGAGEKTPPN